MRSRAGAVALLVASLAVLAVAAIMALSQGNRGLGLELPVAVTDRVAAAGGASGAGSVDDSPPADGGESPRTPDDSDLPSPRPAPVPVRDAGVIEAQPPPAPPRTLLIPRIDVSMPIVATGVLDDGQMQLPENPGTIGWYRFGPAPAERRGSAVLAGHVDSKRYGVGPLAQLTSVRDGDSIVVTSAEGERVRYRVSRVERIRKAALPTARLFDPDSAARLVVVTCGGRYLPEAGGYEDNIVVTARPV